MRLRRDAREAALRSGGTFGASATVVVSPKIVGFAAGSAAAVGG
jgi:hypothetical protein